MEGLFSKAELPFINYSFLRVSLSPLWDIFLYLEHGLNAYLPLINYSLDLSDLLASGRCRVEGANKRIARRAWKGAHQ
jgi:hypothetical protein